MDNLYTMLRTVMCRKLTHINKLMLGVKTLTEAEYLSFIGLSYRIVYRAIFSEFDRTILEAE